MKIWNSGMPGEALEKKEYTEYMGKATNISLRGTNGFRSIQSNTETCIIIKVLFSPAGVPHIHGVWFLIPDVHRVEPPN